MSLIDTALLLDTKNYIENFIEIKTKKQEVIPFNLNPVQKSYLAHRSFIDTQGQGQRDIACKGRQMGFSTLKLAEYFCNTIRNHSTTTVIVGHDDEAMEFLLENVKTMYHSIPDDIKPSMSQNRKGLIGFPEIDSKMYISTYRQLKARSQTINNLLLTEVAFWKIKNIEKVVAGMIESVPLHGNICYESTPNGIGNYFWTLVQKAKQWESTFKYFEYPWYTHPEYKLAEEYWNLIPERVRPEKGDLLLDEIEEMLIEDRGLSVEQIMWRRYKMSSMSDFRTNEKGIKNSQTFSQEYECDFVQSGKAVFDPIYIIPRTVYQEPIKGHKYIHGGDTAEGVEGGNYNVLYTVDLDTGDCVHKERGLWKGNEFAARIHSIAMRYGGLVGIELNNTGHAVVPKIIELWNEAAQELVNKGKTLHDMPYRIFSDKKRHGWNTNTGNRPVIFVDLEELLRTEWLNLAYEDTQGMGELLACIYNDKMKPEAPEGMTDDSIMALGICCQMRKFYQSYFSQKKGSGVQSI
jgi:hypothetical protein